MASKKGIATVISTIKALYPYYSKDINISIVADLWYKLLKNYDDDSVNKALYLYCQTNTYPPTPADLINKLKEMQPKNNIFQLWAEFVKKLNEVSRLKENFSYTFTESNGLSQGQNARIKTKKIFDELPIELKLYVGDYEEMLRISDNLDNDSLKYTKMQFLKHIPDIIEKHQIEIGTKNKNSISCKTLQKPLDNV